MGLAQEILLDYEEGLLERMLALEPGRLDFLSIFNSFKSLDKLFNQ